MSIEADRYSDWGLMEMADTETGEIGYMVTLYHYVPYEEPHFHAYPCVEDDNGDLVSAVWDHDGRLVAAISANAKFPDPESPLYQRDKDRWDGVDGVMG